MEDSQEVNELGFCELDGRGELVDQLEAHFVALRDGEGTPEVVVVRGPMGTGKTRVIQEFYRRLADKHQSEAKVWQPSLTPEADELREAQRKRNLVKATNLARKAISLPSSGLTGKGALPWLWLGVDCNRGPEESGQLLENNTRLKQWKPAAFFQEYELDAKGGVETLVTEGAGALGAAVPGGGLLIWAAKQAFGFLRGKAKSRRLKDLEEGELAFDINASAANEAWAAIAAASATSQKLPLVLIIEDAHLAGRATMQMLRMLLYRDFRAAVASEFEAALDSDAPATRELASHFKSADGLNVRVMVVALAHPESQLDDPDESESSEPARGRSSLSSLLEALAAEKDEGSPATRMTEVEIPPLSDEAIRTIAVENLPEASSDDLDVLVANCSGNPLWLWLMLEIAGVKKLISDGAITDSERWQALVESLPKDVEDMFREIWQALEPEERDLLAVASIQGDIFHPQVVLEVINRERFLDAGEESGLAEQVLAGLRRNGSWVQDVADFSPFLEFSETVRTQLAQDHLEEDHRKEEVERATLAYLIELYRSADWNDFSKETRGSLLSCLALLAGECEFDNPADAVTAGNAILELDSLAEADGLETDLRSEAWDCYERAEMNASYWERLAGEPSHCSRRLVTPYGRNNASSRATRRIEHLQYIQGKGVFDGATYGGNIPIDEKLAVASVMGFEGTTADARRVLSTDDVANIDEPKTLSVAVFRARAFDRLAMLDEALEAAQGALAMLRRDVSFSGLRLVNSLWHSFALKKAIQNQFVEILRLFVETDAPETTAKQRLLLYKWQDLWTYDPSSAPEEQLEPLYRQAEVAEEIGGEAQLDAMSRLHRRLMELGRSAEALDLARQASELTDQGFAEELRVATTLISQGNTTEAETILRGLLGPLLRSEDTAAGKVSLEEGPTERALDALGQVITVNEGVPAAIDYWKGILNNSTQHYPENLRLVVDRLSALLQSENGIGEPRLEIIGLEDRALDAAMNGRLGRSLEREQKRFAERAISRASKRLDALLNPQASGQHEQNALVLPSQFRDQAEAIEQKRALLPEATDDDCYQAWTKRAVQLTSQLVDGWIQTLEDGSAGQSEVRSGANGVLVPLSRLDLSTSSVARDLSERLLRAATSVEGRSGNIKLAERLLDISTTVQRNHEAVAALYAASGRDSSDQEETLRTAIEALQTNFDRQYFLNTLGDVTRFDDSDRTEHGVRGQMIAELVSVAESNLDDDAQLEALGALADLIQSGEPDDLSRALELRNQAVHIANSISAEASIVAACSLAGTRSRVESSPSPARDLAATITPLIKDLASTNPDDNLGSGSDIAAMSAITFASQAVERAALDLCAREQSIPEPNARCLSAEMRSEFLSAVATEFGPLALAAALAGVSYQRFNWLNQRYELPADTGLLEPDTDQAILTLISRPDTTEHDLIFLTGLLKGFFGLCMIYSGQDLMSIGAALEERSRREDWCEAIFHSSIMRLKTYAGVVALERLPSLSSRPGQILAALAASPPQSSDLAPKVSELLNAAIDQFEVDPDAVLTDRNIGELEELVVGLQRVSGLHYEALGPAWLRIASLVPPTDSTSDGDLFDRRVAALTHVAELGNSITAETVEEAGSLMGSLLRDPNTPAAVHIQILKALISLEVGSGHLDRTSPRVSKDLLESARTRDLPQFLDEFPTAEGVKTAEYILAYMRLMGLLTDAEFADEVNSAVSRLASNSGPETLLELTRFPKYDSYWKPGRIYEDARDESSLYFSYLRSDREREVFGVTAPSAGARDVGRVIRRHAMALLLRALEEGGGRFEFVYGTGTVLVTSHQVRALLALWTFLADSKEEGIELARTAEAGAHKDGDPRLTGVTEVLISLLEASGEPERIDEAFQLRVALGGPRP